MFHFILILFYSGAHLSYSLFLNLVHFVAHLDLNFVIRHYVTFNFCPRFVQYVSFDYLSRSLFILYLILTISDFNLIF